MSAKVKAIVAPFDSEDIAKLARLSHYAGYWQPSGVTPLFPNVSGQSWKVSNVLDQILRGRFKLPGNIEIHDGVFRVTFSNCDCWLWTEFGLATANNFKAFKVCGLPFGKNP